MADEVPPPPPLPDSPPPPIGGPSPFNVWMEKSGLHGKMIAGGSAVGILSTFLPLITVSAGIISASASVIQDWRGVLCLLCYIGLLIMSFLLYQAKTPAQGRGFLFGILGAAGGAILFALLLLFAAMNSTGSGFGASASIGIGTILNLLAALTVGAGAFMKAKEDKLF
jgi:hypothetical protein